LDRLLVYYLCELLTIPFKKITEMENMNEEIEMMLIKLKVLENRILHLQTITDEVLNEVESVYHHQIEELKLKREDAQKKLIKIQGIENNE